MKVILYMAMTVNGMIARENDREDFLSDLNWNEFCRLAKSAGCFVVGRRTYDVVKKLYKNYNFDNVEAKKIVVSRNKKSVPDGYIIVKSPKAAIKKAREIGFKNLILTGGSKLNASFMKSNLIDEMILNVEPAVLGKGITVFSENNFYSRLKLKKVKKLSSGIVQLHYKVIRR